MLEQHVRTALEQQQWTFVVKDVSPLPRQGSLIELWKMFANGVAITLSIYSEEGQFVVYEDVGHAASGTNRTEYGRFSTENAAVQQVIKACNRWDGIWEA
jgi:hypothetical protein